MQDTHDERRIALEPQPESRSLLESIRFYLTLGLVRRNKRDERQAKAADLNAVWHDADLERIQRQPGVSPEAAEKALRVLGRIGRGGGR